MVKTDDKKERLIVWDLETTGFNAPECKILEIGAYVIEDGKVISEHSWMLNHGIEIPENITEITGITAEIIAAEGRDPIECLTEFHALMLTAEKNLTHNGIRFDIPFLTKSLLAHFPEGMDHEDFRKKLENGALDTAAIYKAGKMKKKKADNDSFFKFATAIMNTPVKGLKYSVGVCCDELQIDRSNLVQHRAMADAFLTYEIYKKMTA